MKKLKPSLAKVNPFIDLDFLWRFVTRAGLPFVVAVLLAGMAACDCEATTVVSNQLAITSISLQGTNLVLTATIPPGLSQVALQTRLSLDAAWEDSENENAPVSGGEMIFTYPQSGEITRFFRLRASSALPAPEMVSSELEYVPIASLGWHLSNGNAVFHYKGQVQGSDKILITHQGALWTHINWDYPPQPVSVNGTTWNPREKNYMSTAGPLKFLPDSFSLESVDLEVIKGRDIVALERTSGGLMIYLDDTPVGPGDYDFIVQFHPVAPKLDTPRTSTVARLKIKAWESGSDCIKITRSEAVLDHKFWDLPSDLSLNGVSWDARQTMVLKNEGATAFLPDGVDFSTAKIVSRKGRDLATAWGEKDALWVHFADNPNGSDYYEIEIAFGPESTQ